MLKIIISNNDSVVTEHARMMITKLNAREQDNRFPEVGKAKGIPTHRALYPLRCDECGEDYWTNDEYGSHKGCPGFRRGAGFVA